MRVCSPAETVSKNEYIRISLWGNREGTELVDAYRDAKPRSQREQKYRPAHGLWRRFAGLALQSTAERPLRANVHASPPIAGLEHGQGARDSEVTGGVGMTSLHNPRVHD